MFLSGDSHEDSNGASSSSFFVLFLLQWIQLKLLVLIVVLSLFQRFSHADAPLNHPALVIFVSGVLKISQKICVSIIYPFKISRGCYLIQAF